jgi:MFS family permease
MPNVVALIGITVPPGKLRNISLGIFSASAPTGAYIGALIAGAFHQIGAWKWLFFML